MSATASGTPERPGTPASSSAATSARCCQVGVPWSAQLNDGRSRIVGPLDAHRVADRVADRFAWAADALLHLGARELPVARLEVEAVVGGAAVGAHDELHVVDRVQHVVHRAARDADLE